MRILKILLMLVVAVLAVAAGVFVAAIVAAMAVVFLAVRWARRRFGKPVPRRPTKPARGADVIDVAATEVSEPQARPDRLEA